MEICNKYTLKFCSEHDFTAEFLHRVLTTYLQILVATYGTTYDWTSPGKPERRTHFAGFAWKIYTAHVVPRPFCVIRDSENEKRFYHRVPMNTEPIMPCSGPRHYLYLFIYLLQIARLTVEILRNLLLVYFLSEIT